MFDANCLVSLRCLSQQWQHVSLRELLIEGDSLGVTIPALPNLETLLVSCESILALDFTDPEYLGRTITKIVLSAQDMRFHAKQHQRHYRALSTRGLALSGDWSRCALDTYTLLIAVQTMDDPSHGIAEALKQYKQAFGCTCGACPSCLGIGLKRLEREHPSKHAWYEY